MLIAMVGGTVPSVRDKRGDFDAWIARKLDLSPPPVRVVHVQQGEELPSPDTVAGVVVTGSSAMVSDQEPWSVRAGQWLRHAVEHELPVFGICYGHQLLAASLGGRVERNPIGREIGTVSVQLTDAARTDPLFAGLPAQLTVQATHVESVTELPRGAVLLGHNERDPHQAFRVGVSAWGVQFHPEFDADIMGGYVTARREILEREGLDADGLLSSAKDSDDGTRLLRSFGAFVMQKGNLLR